MKLPTTVITTTGRVLSSDPNSQGVTIVSEDGLPLLEISEVSDSEVINIFATVLNGGLNHNTLGVDNTFEILASRNGKPSARLEDWLTAEDIEELARNRDLTQAPK